jgi:hypothetical protein
MTLTRLLAAAGCAALLAGAAHAQSADTTTTVDQNGVETTTTVDPVTGVTTMVDPVTGMTTTAPAATTAGVPASSMTMSDTGAPGTVTTQVVTNGPVPDTAENRAKYGQPMSHAGKRSTPAGN